MSNEYSREGKLTPIKSGAEVFMLVSRILQTGNTEVFRGFCNTGAAERVDDRARQSNVLRTGERAAPTRWLCVAVQCQVAGYTLNKSMHLLSSTRGLSDSFLGQRGRLLAMTLGSS